MQPWSRDLSRTVGRARDRQRGPCAATSSGTPRSARCGSTRRPVTTTSPSAGTPPSTRSRGTPVRSTCGATERCCGRPTSRRWTRCSRPERLHRHRRLRRLLDVRGRQPVPGTRRRPAATTLPLRRGRPVRRRPVPDARRPRAPGDPGQVERRVRRARHADAAARRVRRRRVPLRRLAVRGVLPGGFREGRAGAPRRVRGLVRAILAGRAGTPVRDEGVGLRDWLEAWGYAACYSADPDGTVRLPFDSGDRG